MQGCLELGVIVEIMTEPAKETEEVTVSASSFSLIISYWFLIILFVNDFSSLSPLLYFKPLSPLSLVTAAVSYCTSLVFNQI